jgi:hypothetical protein
MLLLTVQEHEGNPLETDLYIGSWTTGELGTFLRAAINEYRGVGNPVPFVGSGHYEEFLLAITTYDTTGGPPYPALQPQTAQMFLDYMRKNGA